MVSCVELARLRPERLDHLLHPDALDANFFFLMHLDLASLTEIGSQES